MGVLMRGIVPGSGGWGKRGRGWRQGRVGMAMSPPSFLKPGDVVRCEIERLGAIENRVVAET